MFEMGGESRYHQISRIRLDGASAHDWVSTTSGSAPFAIPTKGSRQCRDASDVTMVPGSHFRATELRTVEYIYNGIRTGSESVSKLL